MRHGGQPLVAMRPACADAPRRGHRRCRDSKKGMRKAAPSRPSAGARPRRTRTPADHPSATAPGRRSS
ncbi:hypothetical protein SNL152K_1761 [Streptomyces sp. NL15-2K]|nr:hypothetical protein SNL152K_1761 [Streptomyces sp. NL15-2K]